MALTNDTTCIYTHIVFLLGDKYNIPHCTDCTQEINGWVYLHPEKLLSTELKPELVRRFTQDVYMCVYVSQFADMYDI